ncbi:hypothetical protein [Geotalea toluenoxydans]|uniref:hypothetical protein n=1 Tax=Geotalea toluenoxydans TaxID=421624 RepID=UPI001FB44385|nr:hypothetical protein [Geotalea toluenoxydans]
MLGHDCLGQTKVLPHFLDADAPVRQFGHDPEPYRVTKYSDQQRLFFYGHRILKI